MVHICNAIYLVSDDLAPSRSLLWTSCLGFAVDWNVEVGKNVFCFDGEAALVLFDWDELEILSTMHFPLLFGSSFSCNPFLLKLKPELGWWLDFELIFALGVEIEQNVELGLGAWRSFEVSPFSLFAWAWFWLEPHAPRVPGVSVGNQYHQYQCQKN